MKTTAQIKAMKGKEKIAVLTAYDYSIGKAIDKSEIDIILVGDSLGMVVYGEEDTLNISIEDIEKATRAVSKASDNTMVVADMPYKTYDTKAHALKNAKKLINAGAKAVKPENSPEIVEFLVEEGVPVMGHIGLTPQTVHEFKVQGKDKESAKKILDDAKQMEKAGVFSIVLECIPAKLAELITSKVSIPTIGIGAGPGCDGQVLVSYDMLGLYNELEPKFVKRYADISKDITDAVDDYKQEVKKGTFPAKEHSY